MASNRAPGDLESDEDDCLIGSIFNQRERGH